VFIGTAAAAAAAVGVTRSLGRSWWRFRVIGALAMVIAIAAFPFTQNGDATWIRVLDTVLVLSAAAVGLNVVVGLAGLLDLGYIAFYGFGGYVSAFFSNALFTTVHIHLPFALVLLMGAVIAAFFGIIIGAPTLRLRGDYLAIVTLGFGEIFHVVANGWDVVTRGPNGIAGIPDLVLGGWNFRDTHTVFGVALPREANYYYLALLLLIVVIVIFRNLNDSRIGRAWVAIREDEVAARASGINTTALKLLAFAIGAFLAGLGGAINAHLATQTDPSSYVFDYSATLLAAVVLGGMGTVPGAVIGITLLEVLPERLRFVSNYRLLLFGAALVLMMRFRPEGIWANRRRQREFHDSLSGADAMSQPGQVAPV
jgi:branched-chain amino acid transport system permease protein